MRLDAYEATAWVRREPPQPVYLLAGPGDFPYEGMIRHIAGRIIGRPATLRDVENVDLAVTSLAEVLEGAANLSLFGDAQVILCRSPKSMTDADLKLLGKYLELPDPPSSIIILFTYEREEEQGGRPPAPKAALVRLVEEKGLFIDLTFRPQKGRDQERLENERMLRLISDRGRKAGKTFSRSAARLLADMSGGSLGLARSEADKAVAYAGEKAEVDVEDVNAVGCRNAEAGIFDMIDSLGRGERTAALNTLDRLWEMLAMPDSGKAIYIMTMLARHFRFLLQGASIRARGFQGITPAVSRTMGHELPRDTRTLLTSQHSFVQNKIMNQARHFTPRSAALALMRLHRLDQRLKSSEVMDDREEMERLVVELTERPAGRPAREGASKVGR